MSANGDSAPLDVLERFRRPRPRPGEQCEMCATPIADQHSHLVSLRTRTLLCTCRPCYLVFLPEGAGGGQYKCVPDRFIALPDGALTRSEWDGLQIPVGMAFFFYASTDGEVHAFYPGPAGATESLLPLDAWDRIRQVHPVLATLEADVEALIVRAEGHAEGDPACWLVPIDACYELVGHLRMLWKGFDGGAEARHKVDEFFGAVAAKAKPA